MSKILGVKNSERENAVFLLRPDSLCPGVDSYPLPFDSLGVPSDGQNAEWWHDVSVNGAMFHTAGQYNTDNSSELGIYRSTPGGLETQVGSTGYNFKMLHDPSYLTGQFYNKSFCNVFRTEPCTLVVRAQFSSQANMSSGEHANIFRTGDAINSNVGFQLIWGKNGSGFYVRALAYTSGGSTMYDSAEQNVSISSSGFDTISVSVDPGSDFRLSYNGTEEYNGAPSGADSDTDSNEVPAFGPYNTSKDFNMIFQGAALYRAFDVSGGLPSSLSNWIQGSDLNYE